MQENEGIDEITNVQLMTRNEGIDGANEFAKKRNEGIDGANKIAMTRNEGIDGQTNLQ